MIHQPNDYLEDRLKAGGQFAQGIAEKCATPAGASELYFDIATFVVMKKIAAPKSVARNGTVSLPPHEVGFSQSSVRNLRLDRTTGQMRSFEDLVNSMRTEWMEGGSN